MDVNAKTKRKVESINEFHCCEQVFQRPEFLAHLTSVHGFVKGTKCTRSVIQAIDGSDFYSNVMQWEIPCGDKTIKAQQVNSGPRAKGATTSSFGGGWHIWDRDGELLGTLLREDVANQYVEWLNSGSAPTVKPEGRWTDAEPSSRHLCYHCHPNQSEAIKGHGARGTCDKCGESGTVYSAKKEVA